MSHVIAKEYSTNVRAVGVIPARYGSSRFEGKPLVDIQGKPMIWWIYQATKNVDKIQEVYIATDDERISKVCDKLGMRYVMTSKDHSTPTDRICEVSKTIKADYYVCVNGDEPLIDSKTIASVIPSKNHKGIFVSNITARLNDPVEVMDVSNLKVVVDQHGYGIYISRNPVPCPKGTLEFYYRKYIGVGAFNFQALEFYSTTSRGVVEQIEDTDLLRFIENRIKVQFIETDCMTLSVDTPKDLVRVRRIMSGRGVSGPGEAADRM